LRRKATPVIYPQQKCDGNNVGRHGIELAAGQQKDSGKKSKKN
jgi:hypothetical protein